MSVVRGLHRRLDELQGRLRLGLYEPPDALGGMEKAGLAHLAFVPGALELHGHRLEHAAGPSRQHDHAIGHVHGLLDIVGHVENARARALPDPEQLLHHQRARLRVERGERLVHEEHGGVDGEGPRDAHPLPHAPGELVRIPPLEAFEAGHGDETRRAHPAFRGRQAELFEPEFHVGLRGPPREQGELLEHRGGEGLAGAALPFECHFTRRGGQETGDDTEQGGLAAARRTEDGHELLGLHGEADPVQGNQILAAPVAIGFRQPVHDDAHPGHATA